LLHLGGNRGSLCIHNLGKLPEIAFPLSHPLDGPDIHLPHLARVLEGWQELLNRAGVSSTAEFNLEQIWAANSAIAAVDILLHSARSSSFEFPESPSLSGLPEPIEALHCNHASLADASISFAARVSISRTTDPTYRYRSTSAEMLDVRARVDDLEAYAEEQAAENNLRVVMDPDNIEWVGRFLDD
jgi:hypothetical protein